MNKAKTGLLALTSTLAGALALSACTTSGNSSTASGSKSSAASTPASGNATSTSGKIYLLLPDETTVRFEKFDRPNITAAIHALAPKVQVVSLNADNDASKQLAQIQTAITNGAKAIIEVPVDAKQASGGINQAHQAGIPVITYAHEALGAPVTYHVSVPFEQVGQEQGKIAAQAMQARYNATKKPVRLAEMYGDPAFAFYTALNKGYQQNLAPLVTKGVVKVVCKADALQWIPSNMQTAMDQCLTKTGNGVDAILTMNDDLGGGALAAAKGQGLSGKIALYGGYDATLAGVQRVAEGLQTADMSPPYKAMAKVAAELAVAAATKTQPAATLLNAKFDNGFVKGGVPAAYTPNVLITRDNLQSTVIDAGLYTKSQVCTGSAAQSTFCKG